MPTHRILYEGPASLALRTATLLADAHGVELKSSEASAPRDEVAVLTLTVEGSVDAVAAAVGRVRENLPLEATITVTEVP